MTLNHPLPIKVATRALFAPADGCAYTWEDKIRVFAQQPLVGPALPSGYLIPKPTSSLRPPILKYGWRLGHEKLMSVIRDQFPSAIQRRHGPPELGFGNDELIDFSNEELFQQMNENIAETLYGPYIITALELYLGLDPEREDRIDISPLPDRDGALAPGLTVGTNYVGLLWPEQIAKLQALFAPNMEPMWYLDHFYWTWYRVPKERMPKVPKKASTGSKTSTGSKRSTGSKASTGSKTSTGSKDAHCAA